MPMEPVSILSGAIEQGEAAGYELSIIALVNFEMSTGTIVHEVTNRNGDEVCKVVLEFKIENPLVTSTVVISVATAFASCVAIGVAGVSSNELYKQYQNSKKDNPNYSRTQRCQDVINRIRNAGATLKPGAAGVIAGCLARLGLS